MSDSTQTRDASVAPPAKRSEARFAPLRRQLAAMLLSCCLALPGFGSGLLAAPMELGGNFWNLGWHNPGDCFLNVREVSGENPWNPQFLQEIRLYRSLRFMDWDRTNGSERDQWNQRPQKANRRQNPVAYEWMIDLCNRTGADLWLTVPHRTVRHTTGDQPADYVLRLATLVRTGVDMGEVDLRPLQGKLTQMSAEDLIAAGGVRTGAPLQSNLKLYVEYSNETWNGGFKQAQYCCDEGLLLGLDTNRWTAGFRYHAWAAVRVFHAAELVFGTNSPRLIKVLATQSANPWIAGQHLKVMNDPRFNPWNVRASAIATAPYFGHNVDGKALDALERLRESIRKSAADSAQHRELAQAAGLKLIAYEGGQHLTKNARLINREPGMAAVYREYLTEMSRYFSHFCHYAHVGMAGENGAWGALEYTGQPLTDAPKYRALKEWAELKSGSSTADERR